MKLTFSIDYRTVWGESVYVTGSIAELGNGSLKDAMRMECDGGSSWSCSLTLPDTANQFTYGYVVINDNGAVRHEYGEPRLFKPLKRVVAYKLRDSWQDAPADKPLYSSAFTQGIFSRDRAVAESLKGGCLILKVKAPFIDRNQVLAVSGSSDKLGQWDVAKAVELNDAGFPEWTVAIDINKEKAPFEYKFLVADKATHEVIAWEKGENRHFAGCPLMRSEIAIESGIVLANPMPSWRGAGVAIPVFSLRSEEDFGVGDFYDIFKIVDWAALTGQRIVQILPINDTTMTHRWTDSYPYNANSTFALHPMYLRPEAIGVLNDKEKLERYRAIAQELNALEEVDYERVNAIKTEYVRALFDQFGDKTAATAEFKQFVAANEYWLRPYAAFCVLRDLKGTPEFKQWGKYSAYNEKLVGKLCDEKATDILFVYFQQYHLDKQLREVRNYAHSKGVVLKGDIPIGISRTSVDAWVSPRLFNMDCQAGAPPDDFSILGQNWGFPTYNWDEMSRDGFTWWKNRFKKMAEYFDAYRIDHILGFFRIWQIPMKALHGLLGTFNPAMPYTPEEMRDNYDFWIQPATQTIPYIKEYMLGEIFGEYTEEVKSTFLYPKGGDSYGLQEFADTQQKIERYFEPKPVDDKNSKIKNGLMNLIDEVLFIEDAEKAGTYHPRISAQSTHAYRALNGYEQWCYDRLYNDFFYYRHNDFWREKAMWKLPPLLGATGMLTCGEDLGMIPACVESVMKELQILSLEIQRMPKDPAVEFGDTARYPYYSVCTTSTHDMEGIRQWWETDRDVTQRFYNNVLHCSGVAPYFAEPWICDKILSMHLDSPSMLAILPLQDYLSADGMLRRENPADERINIPANSRHYWRYRMHITLEKLLVCDMFNDYLLNKIRHSGR